MVTLHNYKGKDEELYKEEYSNIYKNTMSLMKHMEVGEFTQKQEDEYFYDFIALSFSKEKVKKIFTANNMSATNLLEL